MSTFSDTHHWDVFLSFAGPDQARAETLCDLLTEQGWEVFLAGRSIPPGAPWDDHIPAAIRASRVVAVLLSEHSGKAHYQRDEIHLAVELARKDALTLVPLYLDGVPADPPDWQFGLKRLHHLDMQQLGPDKVAERLGALLAAPREATPATEPPLTYGDVFHRVGLKVDRTRQWLPILEVCMGRQSALFLLHGPRQQNLDLFVSRILHYLSPECGHHHRPYIVPLRVEFAKPRSSAAWENHLRVGIAGEGRRPGTAEDLLREAARAHPVFLVLSRVPIGAGELDDVELEALEEFFAERLPGLITRATTGGHPIRALLATHYDSEMDSLVARLDERALRGTRSHDLRYLKLPSVRPLEWSDIEEFLDNRPRRPPRHIYVSLQGIFERLDRGSMQFRDVVDLLERELS